MALAILAPLVVLALVHHWTSSIVTRYARVKLFVLRCSMDLRNLARRLASIFGGLPSGFPDAWQLLPPMRVTEDGWLEGVGVERVPSDPSWYYPRLSTPTGDPLAIVCHASATPIGTARTMARNRTRKRTATDRAASWHVSVEPDLVVQQAPLEVGCWHAIGSIKGVGPANRTAVGIELVGFEKGPWPEDQVMTAARVWRAIVQCYGIQRALAMVPHAVIDPDRRSDPGKVWMTEHAAQVLDYAYG